MLALPDAAAHCLSTGKVHDLILGMILMAIAAFASGFLFGKGS